MRTHAAATSPTVAGRAGQQTGVAAVTAGATGGTVAEQDRIPTVVHTRGAGKLGMVGTPPRGAGGRSAQLDMPIAGKPCRYSQGIWYPAQLLQLRGDHPGQPLDEVDRLVGSVG